MKNGWMDLQNEPLVVRIRRNACATTQILKYASTVNTASPYHLSNGEPTKIR